MTTITKQPTVDLNPKESQSGRNYGIDLYKIFAMYMVVVIHILNAGGVLENCDKFSVNGVISNSMRIFVYCAVNCFALSSGYVMINAKYKFSKIVNLWLQVVFYSVIITVVFVFFMPQVTDVRTIIKAFLPMIANQYWYFTSYAFLFLFIPFLNRVVNAMSKTEYRKLVVILIGVFSFMITLGTNMIQTISVEYGYSFWWLAILYIVGGYFGKYGDSIKIKTVFLWLIIIGCVLITGISVYNGVLLESSNKILYVLGKLGRRFSLLSYTSPTIVFIAISLLILFYRLKLKNNRLIKIIKFVSPLAFAVYLIHTNKLIYFNILINSCVKLAEANPMIMILGVLGISLAIFGVCIFIDYFRELLFKLLKVNQKTERLCDLVGNFINKKIFRE